MSKKTENFYDRIQNNFVWIAGSTAAAVGAIYAILKYLRYLGADAYFSYYGIDKGFLDLNNFDNVFNEASLLIIFIILGIAAKSFLSIPKYIEEKKYKTALLSFMLPTFFYIVMIVAYSKEVYFYMMLMLSIVTILTFLLFFIAIEMILKITGSKGLGIMGKLLAYVIVLLFVITLIYSQMNTTSLKNKKDYTIVDGNKVVLYTTPEFYIVARCELKDNNKKLVIYSDFQEKITNQDIETQKMKFDEVKLKTE